MMTKSQLQTLIANNLASGSNVTATNHREVENALLDLLYGTTVTDNQTSQTYTTVANLSGVTYNLRMTKQGGMLFCELDFTWNGSGSLQIGNVFTWKNTDPIWQLANLEQMRGVAFGTNLVGVPTFISNNVFAVLGNVQGGIRYFTTFNLRLLN